MHTPPPRLAASLQPAAMLVAVTLTATLTSCAAKPTVRADWHDVPIRAPRVVALPQVAEISVGPQRIAAKLVVNARLPEQPGDQALRKAVASKAVLKHGVDALIDAKYVIARKSTMVTATVAGYPATYTKIRPMLRSEIPMFMWRPNDDAWGGAPSKAAPTAPAAQPLSVD